MTPFQTYGQTQAPSNMQFPTAAYLQASQNAADMQMRGMDAMGKGLAGGINTAVNEYSKYKDTQAQVKASEKSYETLKSYLPEEVQKQFDTQIESLNKSDSTSLRDKAAFWDQAKGFIGGAVGQSFAMQKQKAELDAAAARQAATLQEQAMAPYRQQAASLLANPMTGTDFGAGQRLSVPPQRQRTDFFGNF